MPGKLSKTDTIETVWPHLTHKNKYVAPIRIALGKIAKVHGNARVRIGITGTGQKPCYRLSYMDGDQEHIVGSYWDMHLALDNETAKSQNWSDDSMTYDELDAFFRKAVGR